MNTTTADDDVLRSLRRLLSRAQSAMRRVEWRVAMQHRAIRIGVALRSVRGMGEAEFERLKVAGGWRFTEPSTNTPVTSVETHCPGRSLEQLGAPIIVVVHRADLVDMSRLWRLEDNGLVRLVVEESAP